MYAYSRTYHERAVGVLESGVRRKDRVVWFNDRVRRFRGRVNRELELRLLAIVSRQTLEQQSTEAGTRSTTKRVENEEALEAAALISQPPQLVHDWVNQLLADGVVATSV